MPVIDVHADSLATSTELSDYYVERFIKPIDVISVLNDAGINFMLVGLHGIVGWLQEPRATQDVDVLVASRHHKKAVKALLGAYSQLSAEDLPVVTRLRDPDTKKVVIDVMKTNQQLYRQALKYSRVIQSEGQTFKIPTLELALAMKFAPMVSLHRPEEDKFQDAHDFILMVKSNPTIDLKILADLGDLVDSEGGKELLEMVRRIRAGEKLQL
jgi:hypothetical protein